MEFPTLTDFTGLTEGYAGPAGSALDTGDLRRGYNFIPVPRVAEMNIGSEPFFGLVSKLRSKPTNDPEFKFAERRPSYHKRYGYVVAHGPTSASIANQATIAAASLEADDTYYWKIVTDYKSAGNIGVIFDANGATRNTFKPGASGTRPEFFLVGQRIKIPFVATGGSSAVSNDNTCNVVEHVLCYIEEITKGTNDVTLKTKVIKAISAERDLAGWSLTDATAGDLPVTDAGLTAGEWSKLRIYDQLERIRVTTCGTAFARGTGYPGTWHDNPFSTGYGHTEITKVVASMDGTAMATELKLEGNEFSRIWTEKLMEYKWDKETSLLFSTLGSIENDDGKKVYFTQGVVDYALSYGNIFALAHATKSASDFLDDMATFLDVRYNNANATLFMCDKYTLNWLMKLGGFAYNNMVAAEGGATAGLYGRSSMTYMGWRDIKLGPAAFIKMHTISTPYGDMNLVHNPHLDGTEVAIAAINMNHVWYRPLVGNGMNRDTTIIVGVQTEANSDIDGRVDLIRGEAGMQIELPEAHAVWKRA